METQLKTEPGKKIKESGIQLITPFLWFNNQAEEAVNFYTSTFKNSQTKFVTHYGAEAANASGMPEGTVMTVGFQIEGQEFAAINGGPIFSITPAISFFVSCQTTQEIDALWEKLAKGGTVMMPLDKYPFSEKYGWIQDKYGVSWQLILQTSPAQKIAPCLLFTGPQFRKAEEAINFYISVFRNSSITHLEYYKGGEGPEGAVVHSKFVLNGQEFVAMDAGLEHSFTFTPALSLVVNCDTQEEIDYYWDKLSEGGFEEAQQCGWLQDKFGVSWQVVPTELGELLSGSDQKRSARVMQSLLQMKKLDLNALRQAYNRQ
jgi:predicted 3-demethylubiquinone-9 3-methyltransferase (glyoxalase superfamily)